MPFGILRTQAYPIPCSIRVGSLCGWRVALGHRWVGVDRHLDPQAEIPWTIGKHGFSLALGKVPGEWMKTETWYPSRTLCIGPAVF